MSRRRVPLSDRPRRRRRRTPAWLKVFWIGSAAVVLIVSFAVVCKIVRPVRFWWQARTQVHQLERQLTVLQQENQALKDKRAYLQSTEGAVVEARRFGYVKPGEISVIVEKPSKPKKDEDKSDDNL